MNLTKIETTFLVLLVAVVASQIAYTQTFTKLHDFAGTSASDGSMPGYGTLVQGLDGDLYGTTIQGGVTCSFEGSPGCGEVFKITTGGSITGLYSFCAIGTCPDGSFPEGGLALNTNGILYGMTDLGGSAGEGTVFKITPTGTLTTLDSFGAGVNDGGFPLTTLIRAANGSFYGITNSGGTNGEGVVIKVTAAGALTVLHSFVTATDGSAQGDTGALIQGTDGNFYAVNATGGSGTDGTVFRVTPTGAIKVLHSFTGTDGNDPTGTLAQGADGNFYGTTRQGGAHSEGTVFKVTPNGVFTNLYNFCAVNGCPDGFDPVGGLIVGTDGNFYGTTLGGGTGNNPHGTVFQITPGGTLTTLHSFNGPDGAEPFAGVVQHTDGTFYGMTDLGGTNDMGTVFSLSVGLGPFAELLTTSGKVGASVVILGGGLTGTSNVSFSGTSASFKVVSDTEITATVPAGAFTGFVTVTTPSAPLTSSKKFLVIPQFISFSPPSGPVGTVVTITGVSLAQTTSVKIGSKPMTFKVNSDTQITATVPAGASSGKITVTTPGGKATSATSFTVN